MPMLTTLTQLVLHLKKARVSIDKRKRTANALAEGSQSNSPAQHGSKPPAWHRLPVELQVKIFAFCGIRDLYQLRLVSRAFSEVLTSQEQAITRQYLRQRRHGTLPSAATGDRRKHTGRPEDDAVLLSDLFPPATSAKGGHIYTFRYLLGLRRRQQLCSRLCYYLADRIVDRFVHLEADFMKFNYPGKNDRHMFIAQAVAIFCFHLTPVMYYVHYFLETYALARREKMNSLVRDYEERNLAVPIPQAIRRSMYREMQVRILRSPPFTDTATLISTHHCMQLLRTCLQRTVPLDDNSLRDDTWIASLLTVSPFVRIVEYFSAEIGDGPNQRGQRKDFMLNFHKDLLANERDDLSSVIFGQVHNGNWHESNDETWFDIAREELVIRGAAPHSMEQIDLGVRVPFVFGCEKCWPSAGWAV